MNFLDRMADYIRRFDDTLDTLKVIVPNKRLERKLSALLAKDGKTCWMPEILGLDEFMFSASGLRSADSHELLILLYQAYQKTDIPDKKDMDSFWEWGRMMMTDFSEIDAQLADAEKVFGILHAYKSLDDRFLFGDMEDIPTLQSNYMRFYEELFSVYTNFTQKMEEKKCAYQAYAARKLCQKIEEGKIESVANEKFLFFGFNALTAAEKYLIRFLIRQEKAEIFWEADSFYFDDPKHEAGLFLREYAQDPYLGKHIRSEDYLCDRIRKLRNIQIYETPQSTAQVKWAARILDQNPTEGSTAWVLADESMVLPVLSSIPSAYMQDCNISVALPLHSTDAHALCVAILESVASLGEEFSMSTQSLSLCLENKILQNYFASDSLSVRKALSKLYTFKQSRIGFAAVDAVLNELKTNPSKNFETRKQLFLSLVEAKFPLFHQKLCEFVEELSQRQEEIKSDYEKEYIYQWQQCLDKISDILDQYSDIVIGMSAYQKMLFEKLSSISLSFRGDPESHLQITGVLETRALAFDHVYIFSANEGVLPKSAKSKSFLLAGIKRYFGMPGEKEKNAIYAYYFYRLLQNAKTVHIFYTTAPTQGKAGVKSHFVLQVEKLLPFTLASEKGESSYKEYFQLKNPQSGSIKKAIVKTPEMIDRITSYLQGEEKIISAEKRLVEGLSPTALNDYLSCSMRFYLKYLLGLKEEESLIAGIGDDIKGSMIHQVLEMFFKKRLQRNLNAKDAEDFALQYAGLLDQVIANKLPGLDFSLGSPYLLRYEMQWFMNAYAALLKKEIENGLSVLEVEYPLYASFCDLIPSKTIRIGGIMDRIDSYNGTLRIIDYKSGKIEADQLKIDFLSEKEKDGKAIQLALYALAYQYHHPEVENFEAKIYSMRNLKEDLKLRFCQGKEMIHFKEAIPLFKEYIKEVLEDLLDPEQSFAVCENKEHCKYCPYLRICGERP